jgi:hypothetical protein
MRRTYHRLAQWLVRWVDARLAQSVVYDISDSQEHSEACPASDDVFELEETAQKSPTATLITQCTMQQTSDGYRKRLRHW